MDLDHLKKLVDASIEEAEETGDCGKAYAELESYLVESMPNVLFNREGELRAALKEALDSWAAVTECEGHDPKFRPLRITELRKKFGP